MPRIQIIGIVFIGLILFTLPLYVSTYMTQIAVTTITYSMLGLGFAFGMRVGLPRFDMAAWWGVGGYTTAILMTHGVSFWITLIASVVIAGVLGLVIFALIIPRGLIAFFTFCMVLSMAVYQMFGSVSFFGGWGGITGVPSPSIFAFTINSPSRIYYLGIFFLIITVTVYYLLFHSRIGRAWDSINSSLKLAQAVGVNVVRYRLTNVVIGNCFIALSGSFFVSYYGAAIPSIFSFNAGVASIVYLFIGGFGHSLIGPIIGAIIATFIPEYLRFAQAYQTISTAAVVILILLFFPMGILGIFDERIIPRFKKSKLYISLDKWGITKAREPVS